MPIRSPRPIGQRVALRRLAPSAAASPFILPDSGKEKPLECEVVAVPALPYVSEWGAVLHCPVRIGDCVLVGKYTAGEIKVEIPSGGDEPAHLEDWLFVRWEELLAVESGGAAGVTVETGGAAASANAAAQSAQSSGNLVQTEYVGLKQVMNIQRGDPPAVLTGAIPSEVEQ